MADFKGFKQVTLSTYLATSEENRKNYLWFVRDFSGETVIGSAIYFGNRKYADLTGEEAEIKAGNLIASLGDIVDENGEWVGFLPIEEHEILGNSGITSAADALSALEAAIISNADAISGKVDKNEFDEKIAELENKLSGSTESVEELTESVSDLSGRVDEIQSELSEKASASDLINLSGAVETKISELSAETEELTEEISEALSALTSEIDKKANASDVYTKNEVYTKEEIDEKVVGAFKFKGNAESISADETTLIVNGEPVVASSSNEGDVYQIGDAEYASNGEKWVKLGFNIDLSNYATKDFVNSAISEEAAAREALAEELEMTQSALTKEIEEREELEVVVEDINERATITAETFTDASEIEGLRLGRIVYVLNEETISGVTYGSGAYINTQSGLKKLDATAPSSSTTLEDRVETLENQMADVESTIGDTAISGSTLTGAIAALQEKFSITGDDVDE